MKNNELLKKYAGISTVSAESLLITTTKSTGSTNRNFNTYPELQAQFND